MNMRKKTLNEEAIEEANRRIELRAFGQVFARAKEQAAECVREHAAKSQKIAQYMHFNGKVKLYRS